MIPRPVLRGLYAVTSEAICRSPDVLLAAVQAALLGGARLIQYRDKLGAAAQRQRNARALCRLCRDHHALLIVNDDPGLAAAVGADGVHLGSGDPAPARARNLMPAGAIVGVSCGNSIERALAAAAQGTDYVAFGRFFASHTKPDAAPAEPALLGEARARLSIPICAIGGITPENAGPLIAAGADLIAAVDGVFGAPGVQRAAKAYADLFP